MKKQNGHLIILLLLALSWGAVAQPRVDPTWESINQRGYPQWFRDAKLGIFVHWGLYSVPAYASPEGYGEWFYRGLMCGDSARMQVLNALTQPRLNDPDLSATLGWPDSLRRAIQPYAALRDRWHAEQWNPDTWADLFRRSGARYVLLVTKHHDGYCLWDYPTALGHWNSVTSGPHRNIVEELTTAVRRQGLRMGFYYSLTEWTNPIHTWCVSPNDSINRYVEEYMIPQFRDLVTRYQPSVLFTDGEWFNSAEQFHARDLISWYYNTIGPEAVVNDRWGAGNRHGFRTPEYSGGILDTVTPWAECRGIGRSFGVNHNERMENFVSSEELIAHFVQLVAAGGGMTLNVGPEADGTIPPLQQQRLLDLGHWLELNGEAIYGCRSHSQPFLNGTPLHLQRTDSMLNFNWSRNAPLKGMTCDHFDITWQGDIDIPYSERYTFTADLDGDDDLLVLLDGDTLLHVQHPQANPDVPGTSLILAQREATVKLQAGTRHHITVCYHEQEKEALLQLRWRSKHLSEQPLAAAEGFAADYRCQLPSLCFTRQGDTLYAIALQPPTQELSIPLSILPQLTLQTNIPPTKTTQSEALPTVTYLPNPAKPLSVYRDDTHLHIRTTNLTYSDLQTSHGAWVFRIPLK